MLARVAERLYWFARYVERTENTARLLLVQHQLVLDLPAAIQPGWGVMIDVLGAGEDFARSKLKPTEKNVVAFVFGDKANPSSIISCISYARENIRTTREVMPSEIWERINSLYLSLVQRARSDLPRSNRHAVLNDVIQRCQQITGLLSGCMNHDAAYQFIVLGRNLERADMSTRIIDVGSAQLLGDDEDIQPYRNALWISVLKSLSAYQMYRLNVRRNVKSHDVLAFLLHSEVFPRAVAHTLNEIQNCCLNLPNHNAALGIAKRARKHLHAVELSGLRGDALHSFIDEVQLNFDQIHQQIVHTWFRIQNERSMLG